MQFDIAIFSIVCTDIKSIGESVTINTNGQVTSTITRCSCTYMESANAVTNCTYMKCAVTTTNRAYVQSAVTTTNRAYVQSAITVTSRAYVQSAITVTSRAYMQSAITVTSRAYVQSAITVTSRAYMQSTNPFTYSASMEFTTFYAMTVAIVADFTDTIARITITAIARIMADYAITFAGVTDCTTMNPARITFATIMCGVTDCTTRVSAISFALCTDMQGTGLRSKSHLYDSISGHGETD